MWSAAIGGGGACLAALLACAAYAGETRYSQSPDNDIGTWETENAGVYLRMTQITPDQARAFMVARGLDDKSVEEFARHCVFMTVLRNESKRPINYCLAEWRYVPEGGTVATDADQARLVGPFPAAQPAQVGQAGVRMGAVSG